MNLLKNLIRIRNFIFDLISFGSPLAIVINLSAIILLLIIFPTDFLTSLPIKSVFKDFLLPLIFFGNCPKSGIFKDCNVYSTGETRGLSRLLHLDFSGAFNYNPLVFLLFAVMIFLIIINIIKLIRDKKSI